MSLSAFFWFLTPCTRICATWKNLELAVILVVVLPFCLGLLSKPMGVTLPFALLLVDFWPLREAVERRTEIWEKAYH